MSISRGGDQQVDTHLISLRGSPAAGGYCNTNSNCTHKSFSTATSPAHSSRSLSFGSGFSTCTTFQLSSLPPSSTVLSQSSLHRSRIVMPVELLENNLFVQYIVGSAPSASSVSNFAKFATCWYRVGCRCVDGKTATFWRCRNKNAI